MSQYTFRLMSLHPAEVELRRNGRLAREIRGQAAEMIARWIAFFIEEPLDYVGFMRAAETDLRDPDTGEVIVRSGETIREKQACILMALDVDLAGRLLEPITCTRWYSEEEG